MKKAFKALWHGIKAVFTAVVDGVATLFGMKDDTKYGKSLRRIVSTSFALIVLVWAVYTIIGGVYAIYWNNRHFFGCDDDEAHYYDYLSDNLTHCRSFYDDGYLVNAEGEKVLEHVLSISRPMEGDSLVWFSDGEHRGYFHMRDGRLVVEPVYEHAWVFSDGLAAVEERNRVKFIDTAGRVVIDRSFAYSVNDDGYVFHRGHCAVNDSMGHHKGLIDRNGDWTLPPIYNSIIPIDTFWLVTLDDRQALLTFDMDTIFPLTEAQFEIRDTAILALFKDHTVNVYSFQGTLLAADQISDVELLMYDTREVVYPDTPEDGSYYDNEPYFRRAAATCLCYETYWEWYGLMSPDGRRLTPPIYSRITAVGKDLYLCKTSYGHGDLLNSQGKKVR